MVFDRNGKKAPVAFLSLFRSIVLTLLKNIVSTLKSYLYRHFLCHKFLAVTNINTRNDLEKRKCDQRSIESCVFLEELDVEGILNVIN